VLCTGENKSATRCCTQVSDDVEAVALRDLEEVVRHLRFVFFGRLNFVGHWVLEELANQLVDSTVKRCREEQTLSFAWCLFKNACDVLKESELGHVIGFVQDGALNSVKFNLA
jgi:hypothetical protein